MAMPGFAIRGAPHLIARLDPSKLPTSDIDEFIYWLKQRFNGRVDVREDFTCNHLNVFVDGNSAELTRMRQSGMAECYIFKRSGMRIALQAPFASTLGCANDAPSSRQVGKYIGICDATQEVEEKAVRSIRKSKLLLLV